MPALPPASPALRPPLNWGGGKRWQLPHLHPIWLRHRHRRLVEPFCGGLAVALGLRPDRAWLNDANPHVINFYQWVQRGLVIASAQTHSEAAYYRNRTRFNRVITGGDAHSAEAAALFYYLNRTGYNGLCRFNQSGEFNVPFGRYKKVAYVRDFTPWRDALAGWRFTTGDFEAMSLAPDDFVYADPPYDVEFTQYARAKFTWDDQVRTATWLSRHRGPVVLVNQATTRVRELYGDLGFTLRYHDAPRRISCNGDRRAAKEILAIRE
jgi:DNA adenine methylase